MIRTGRPLVVGLLVVSALVVLGLIAARPAHARTITVNSTGDPGTGGCNAAECTLREAINVSNALPSADAISFAIPDGPAPGLEVKTISPTSLLPAITDRVTVDGYTQAGAVPNGAITNANSAVLKVELSGTGAPSNAFGLAVSGADAAGTVIRGLAINRFGDVGVFVNSPGTVLEGNFIGTNAAGNADLGNGSDGVQILSNGCRVGGSANAAQNVISGNGRDGVAMKRLAATANAVLNNHIGTDADADADLGNAGSGVFIEDAPGNTVGGNGPHGAGQDVGNSRGEGNIISGNDGEGVRIIGESASGNKVLGNYVGLNRNGNGVLGNALDGVLVSSASEVEVGGTGAGQGNTISDNGRDGVEIFGPSAAGNGVLGNRVGTNFNGSSIGNGSYGNARQGVFINDAPGNVVGGTRAGARNLISGNSNGVYIQGEGADGNRVLGNFVGVDATGGSPTSKMGNTSNGVLIEFSADDNTVGGADADDGVVDGVVGARNVVSDNGGNGVRISLTPTGNRVLGNLIGTDATGEAAKGNTLSGVLIGAPGNVVGGTEAGARNVISGNDVHGLHLAGTGAVGNEVVGNFIGTGKDGNEDLGNLGNGVQLNTGANGNLVGGTAGGAGNVISGNGTNGIAVLNQGSTDNRLEGNLIGTDAGGTASLGNGGDGVDIDGAAGNTVGGATNAHRNVISGNGGDGVIVSGPEAIGNRILRNSISSNDGLGIDLEGGTENAQGATQNDPRDPDSGPNTLQNRPSVSSATTSGDSLTVTGNLNSTPNRTFTVQFFRSPSGNEGRTFVAQRSVTTNANGNASLSFTFNVSVPAGQTITATATGEGNTSEFSAPRVVAAS